MERFLSKDDGIYNISSLFEKAIIVKAIFVKKAIYAKAMRVKDLCSVGRPLILGTKVGQSFVSFLVGRQVISYVVRDGSGVHMPLLTRWYESLLATLRLCGP